MDVAAYVEKDKDPWDLLKTGMDKGRAALLKNHVGKSGLVLDVGCAFGIYSSFLRGMGNYVVGMDASKRMVREGAKMFPKLTFAVGSGETLPFQDDTFNAALCMGTLIYSPDKSAFLSELHRVIRKRGRLCVIERNRHSPLQSIIGKLKRNEKAVDSASSYFTVGELRSLLEDAGFTIHKISGDQISVPFFSSMTEPLAQAFPRLAYFLVFDCRKE